MRGLRPRVGLLPIFPQPHVFHNWKALKVTAFLGRVIMMWSDGLLWVKNLKSTVHLIGPSELRLAHLQAIETLVDSLDIYILVRQLNHQMITSSSLGTRRTLTGFDWRPKKLGPPTCNPNGLGSCGCLFWKLQTENSTDNTCFAPRGGLGPDHPFNLWLVFSCIFVWDRGSPSTDLLLFFLNIPAQTLTCDELTFSKIRPDLTCDRHGRVGFDRWGGQDSNLWPTIPVILYMISTNYFTIMLCKMFTK